MISIKIDKDKKDGERQPVGIRRKKLQKLKFNI